MIRAAGVGAALGLLWGVAARLFMRLFALTPEFSWSGTLAIVGVSGVMGLLLGLVHGARLARRSRWWRLAPLPSLILFAGPGMLLVPGVLTTALAARSSRWPLRLAVAAPGLALSTWGAYVAENHLRPVGELVAPLSLFLVCAAAAGLGWGTLARRWPARRPEARPAGEWDILLEGAA